MYEGMGSEACCVVYQDEGLGPRVSGLWFGGALGEFGLGL